MRLRQSDCSGVGENGCTAIQCRGRAGTSDRSGGAAVGVAIIAPGTRRRDGCIPGGQARRVRRKVDRDSRRPGTGAGRPVDGEMRDGLNSGAAATSGSAKRMCRRRRRCRLIGDQVGHHVWEPDQGRHIRVVVGVEEFRRLVVVVLIGVARRAVVVGVARDARPGTHTIRLCEPGIVRRLGAGDSQGTAGPVHVGKSGHKG